jgi:hypothetical protein
VLGWALAGQGLGFAWFGLRMFLSGHVLINTWAGLDIGWAGHCVGWHVLG